MDQNQINDSELQKAIDDITKGSTADAGASLGVADTIAAGLGAPAAPAAPAMPAMPAAEPAAPVAETAPAAAEPAPAMPAMSAVPSVASYGDPDIAQVKEAALRELFPLMDKINVNPVQKFRIYKDIVELTHDKSVIEPAYSAARKISDERARAEALLFLVELIDNLGL